VAGILVHCKSCSLIQFHIGTSVTLHLPVFIFPNLCSGACLVTGVHVLVLTYKGTAEQGEPHFVDGPAVQLSPRCERAGSRFCLDYLAYLMIFASLPCSIVFTRTPGY
jgi:hypothetical protein